MTARTWCSNAPSRALGELATWSRVPKWGGGFPRVLQPNFGPENTYGPAENKIINRPRIEPLLRLLTDHTTTLHHATPLPHAHTNNYYVNYVIKETKGASSSSNARGAVSYSWSVSWQSFTETKSFEDTLPSFWNITKPKNYWLGRFHVRVVIIRPSISRYYQRMSIQFMTKAALPCFKVTYGYGQICRCRKWILWCSSVSIVCFRNGVSFEFPDWARAWKPDFCQSNRFLAENIAFNPRSYYVIDKTFFSLLHSIMEKSAQASAAVREFMKCERQALFGGTMKPSQMVLSSSYELKGLWNLGATCYANSVLQQLCAVPEFRVEVLAEEHDKESWYFFFQLLFARLTAFPAPYINTTEFFSHWSGRSGEKVNVREQQGAVEFLQLLLDKINDMSSGTISVFQGEVQQDVVGVSVDFKSSAGEKFTTLCMEVCEQNNLDESINTFLLSDYYKNYLSEEFGQIDVHKILRAPTVLVLHLKRFDYDWTTERGMKIDKRYYFHMIWTWQGPCRIPVKRSSMNWVVLFISVLQRQVIIIHFVTLAARRGCHLMILLWGNLIRKHFQKLLLVLETLRPANRFRKCEKILRTSCFTERKAYHDRIGKTCESHMSCFMCYRDISELLLHAALSEYAQFVLSPDDGQFCFD